MVTLKIQADEELVVALEAIAEQKLSTVEEVARQALGQYLQAQPVHPKTYSFIGIGHSGKGQLAADAETILAKGASRREGWSLAE